MTAPTQLMYLIASKYTVRHRSPAGPARMRRHSPPVPESANSNHSSPFKAIDHSSPFKVISLSSPFKGEARRGMGSPPGFPQLPPTPRPKTHSMTTPSHPHRTPGVHP
jgi:hypothetical protein